MADAGSAPLSNVRHERFAQLVASGQPHTPAYVAAGFTATGNGAEVNAHRLLSTTKVRARVDFLLAQQAKRLQITADMIAAEAWKIAQTGKVEVARVSALTLLSKQHKEFSEKHVVSGDPEQPVIIERRTRSTR